MRPLTTLGRKGAAAVDGHRVALYEQARARLLGAGYRQVSMRMFTRAAPKAAPVYACQADGMIGLGCGARSYASGVHYSTEWAVGARGVRDILDRWVVRDDAAFAVADYGIVLDDDEQRRRWVILSLLSEDGLDLTAYRARFSGDALAHLPQLAELGAFATRDGDILRLTAEGLAHADAIGPWLGSPTVRARMAEFDLR